MSQSHDFSRSLTLLGLALGAFACDSTTDIIIIGPGHASVAGQVTTSEGAPVPAATVRINCPGVSPVLITADAAGRYGANLSTSEQAMLGHNGQVSCHFTEPAVGPPHVQVDKVLGFALGSQLVPLQMVDLQEE